MPKEALPLNVTGLPALLLKWLLVANTLNPEPTMLETFDLELTNRRDLNPDTAHFTFRRRDGKPLHLTAGQFIRLYFPDGNKEAFRSYSVGTILPANEADTKDIEIAVSWVPGGLATGHLQPMQPGDGLRASGPYGRFVLPEPIWHRYLLIATGTGVTPYRAMLNELRKRLQTGAEVYVIMGARDESGLLYEADFEKVQAEFPDFHYLPCLSRVPRDTPKPNDMHGHVQDAIKSLDINPATDIAYLCGNPNMVDETFVQLKEEGLPVAQIRREKYVSPRVRSN